MPATTTHYSQYVPERSLLPYICLYLLRDTRALAAQMAKGFSACKALPMEPSRIEE